MPDKSNIVVVGAGVSGLTSALLLAQDTRNSVTIVAKHMPGDYAAEYASPFAGANVVPMASGASSRWERRTWPVLKKLTEETPEAGIHFQACHVQRREQDLAASASGFPAHVFAKDPWYKELFGDYRELAPEELTPGFDSGCAYTGVCINTAIYLPWLLGQCLKHGAVARRAVLDDIREARRLSHTGETAGVVVNATGLGSIALGGVRDKTLAPARGQVVLVRNESSPMLICSGTADGPGEELYVMQRAAGGGTILGGTYDVGNWDPRPDPNVASRIIHRVLAARPDIASGKGAAGLSIVRHAVGLRPWREGGLRLEKERLDDGTWVVHNYGHAGWGYQGSYGCAERVVELVRELTGRAGAGIALKL